MNEPTRDRRLQEESDIRLVDENPTVRVLWLLVGASFATFAAVFLKVNVGFGLYLAAPLVSVALIGGISFVGIVLGKSAIRLPLMRPNPSRLLFFLMLVFLLLLFIGTLRSYDTNWALKDTLKTVGSFTIFWCIVTCFPRDTKFHSQFWLFVIGGSAIVIGALVYRYYFVFHSPFLGNMWGEGLREGRNLLGWYIALIVPISAAGAMASRYRVTFLATTILFVGAAMYTGSRSSMGLSVIGILITTGIVLLDRELRQRAKNPLAIATALAALTAIYFWQYVIQIASNFEFYTRVIDLMSGEGKSQDLRLVLVNTAWKCYENGSVLFGMGLKNVVSCIGQDAAFALEKVVHNDYVSILADLGLVGIFSYSAILLTILLLQARKIFVFREGVSWPHAGLFASTILAIISLNFTTGYNSPLLWSILGLAVACTRVDFAKLR